MYKNHMLDVLELWFLEGKCFLYGLNPKDTMMCDNVLDQLKQDTNSIRV